ncbi:TetR/AcrR family transcriptional regulator [Nocardioides sp. B-3]|uniref:TetR/AcrR family transcriptional regulator n=1 Tax=Nocardioides sp. B-3 TaxID=2895565 RepID=UPI002152C12F|nr:TetR/AcrR family transcriptional regulator [Nocardioides sp. B-3]UUZ58081.1 TetR/AcrR family transcriptional regulator [Nocardioides sp. B-3]
MPNITVADRLRDAAFDLFVEQGYDATSVDQIVERAGVGRSTYFRTYPTKEAVIFPDHEEVLARIEARLEVAEPGQHFPALREAARLVLRHYLDEGDHARARYRLTRSVPALREREIAGMQRYRGDLPSLHPRLGRRGRPGRRPACRPPCRAARGLPGDGPQPRAPSLVAGHDRGSRGRVRHRDGRGRAAVLDP